MNLFKDYTFKWWEMGIFKVGMLLIGAIIGAYWADFFLENVIIVAVLAAILVLYISYSAFKK